MGTWIEILRRFPHILVRHCRSLQWERGLKYLTRTLLCPIHLRRSLQWERGLKWPVLLTYSPIDEVVPCNGNVDWNPTGQKHQSYNPSRSLQWERGLKCFLRQSMADIRKSFPAMGTWIEMFCARRPKTTGRQSFPAMGTWIEILYEQVNRQFVPRRSLQWERGLKSCHPPILLPANMCRSLQWERGLK